MALSLNLRIPSRADRAYMRDLQEKRIAAARKADPKAFAAFEKAAQARYRFR